VSGFLVRRVLGLVPTMLVIVTLAFFLVRLAPGGPFDSERAIPPEVKADLERKYALDRPLVVQYGLFLKSAVRGDLGISMKYQNRTVNEIIADGFPATLAVGTLALLWALLLGIGAGVIGAVRQNTPWDYAAMSFAMLGISIPSFVLGPLLALTLGLTLYLFPPAGWGTWRHVVLPAITLGTIYAAYVARLTRGGLLEIVRQDFVRTARAKGLPERLVIWRHVLKGGLLPVVTYLGPMLAALFTGSVVVEKIFATPGTGSYFVDSALNRDLTLTLGMVVFYSAFLLLANLAVDLSYGFLDPRVRHE
jgi:oligopeptide transport system permease protein